MQLGNDELCLTRRRVELPFVARIVRQVEDVLAYPDVKILEAGNDMIDVIADPIVVRDKALPINLAATPKRCLREATNDCRLAHQVIARWVGVTARRTDDPHRVFDGDELLARFLAVNLRSAEARQDKCDLPGDKMRPV